MEFPIIAVVAAVLVVVAGFLLMQSGSPKKGSKSSSKAAPAKAPAKLTIRHDINAAEVAKHNSRESCWIVVDNNVYDVTDYIDEHPGGEAIMNNAGGDATVGAHGPQHPPSMWDVLKLYYIGELQK